MMPNKNPTYQELEKLVLELEKKLKKSEERSADFQKQNNLLHPIFDSPKGVIIFSLDLNYCYTAFTVSHKETMKFIWGKDIEIGMNMLEVINSPIDREKANLNFAKTLRGEHFIIDEEYGDENLNRSFWENRYSPLYDDNNTIIGLTVLVTDITQRKLIQKELDLQNEKLYELNNALNEAQKLAHVGSWSFNPSNGQQQWSEEMFHIWGFELTNGAPELDAVIQRIHPDDLELFNSCLEETLNLGTSFDIEFRICIPDLKPKMVRSLCKPILDINDKVISLTGATQDITSQKLFEQAQVKHQRLKAIGEMASAIAHDFNNSLQEMMGNLEVIKLQNNFPDNVLERLNNIGSTISDVAERVSALQKFGDAENEDKNAQLINFSTLIQESLNQSRPLWKDGMEKKGLSINIITDFQDIPKISCNRGELKSAVYNLIKNSIEAMPEGGDLIIKTSIKDERVFATFTDTGIGMDKETKLKVFEPFYTTKGFKLGRGLGMSGVYRIVKKHRGNIAVTSSVLGKGTTIEIDFPISQQDEVEVTHKNELKNKASYSILWVDDDLLITAVARMLVESIGHTCNVVNSGKKALELLKNNTYNIVFTDIGMPEMNGWELVAAIRNKFGNKIKIVAVSGWDIKKKDKEEHGIDLVMQKPFTLEVLKKSISDCISLF
ncbi:MAG: response regulator [Aureispira sp.]|nr:response regulator [Aureispira sp.]